MLNLPFFSGASRTFLRCQHRDSLAVKLDYYTSPREESLGRKGPQRKYRRDISVAELTFHSDRFFILYLLSLQIGVGPGTDGQNIDQVGIDGSVIGLGRKR